MLDRLDDDDTAGLLNIVDSVAKLNASSRNNDKLSQPKTDEERTNDVVRKKFGSRLNEAVVVNGD